MRNQNTAGTDTGRRGGIRLVVDRTINPNAAPFVLHEPTEDDMKIPVDDMCGLTIGELLEIGVDVVVMDDGVPGACI